MKKWIKYFLDLLNKYLKISNIQQFINMLLSPILNFVFIYYLSYGKLMIKFIFCLCNQLIILYLFFYLVSSFLYLFQKLFIFTFFFPINICYFICVTNLFINNKYLKIYMKNLNFILILVLVATVYSLNNTINSATLEETFDYVKNYIVNGDFQLPVSSSPATFKSINGWSEDANQIRIGSGTSFNTLWKWGQVCQLSSKNNSKISQLIFLTPNKYLLIFNHANRQSIPISQNKFSVYWNDKLVKTFIVDDYQPHEQKIVLNAKDGYNKLQFRGQGNVQGAGQIIDNVRLFSSKTNPIITEDTINNSPTKLIFDATINLLKNGDFEEIRKKNSQNFTTAWKQTTNTIGIGKDYNSNWTLTNNNVVKLDNSKNVNVSQTINLSAGKYKLVFSHANQENTSFSTNRFSVYWNHQLLHSFYTRNYDINQRYFVVQGLNGANILQFIGQGQEDNKGTTIDNVALHPIKINQPEPPKYKHPINQSSQYNQTINLIDNSEFQYPDLNGTQAILSQVGDWYEATNSIRITHGSHANLNWKSGQILQLDANQNSKIKQNITNLIEGPYKLTFDHANRQGVSNQSNKFSLYWNDKLIQLFQTQDELIHSEVIILYATRGNNTLQFRGEGTSDGRGHGIDNIYLHPLRKILLPPTPVKKINTVELDDSNIFDRTKNFIVNGQFQLPYVGSPTALSNVPGWFDPKDTIKLAPGTYYNRLWRWGSVLTLQNIKNSNVSQLIYLEPGQYKLTFIHANKQYTSVQSNRFGVYWNEKQLKNYTNQDYIPRQQTLIITVPQGINRLQFRGLGTSDKEGHLIDEVKLYKSFNKTKPYRNPVIHTPIGLNFNAAINLLQNSRFQYVYTNGVKKVLRYPGIWVSANNETQIGPGILYNPNWTASQVLELDAKKNSRISQRVSLPEGKFKLMFNYANRFNVTFDTSQFSVYWNGKLLHKFYTPDYDIHREYFVVDAIQGINKVEFRGEGPSDGYGAQIDDVQLHPIKVQGEVIKKPTKYIPVKNYNDDGIYIDDNQNYDGYWPINDYDSGNGQVEDQSQQFQKVIDWANTPADQNNTQNPSPISQKQIILPNPNVTVAPKGAIFDTTKNYISNGGFQIPKVIVNDSTKWWLHNKTINSWNTVPGSLIQIANGNHYNPNWNSGQVAELNSNNKYNLTQNFLLKNSDLYQLTFDHASRRGFNTSENKFSVYWNNKLIASFNPTDYKIHRQTFYIKGVQGVNQLKFVGQGTKQHYGQTIDNVKLYGLDPQSPEISNEDIIDDQDTLPQPQKEYKDDTFNNKNGNPGQIVTPPKDATFDDKKNYIINGKFEIPDVSAQNKNWINTNDSGSWQDQNGDKIQIGKGTYYNPRWKSGQVLSLASDKNNKIRQKLSLKAGIYQLNFDHASRINRGRGQNQFAVYWNGKLVKYIYPSDQKIHRQTFYVNAIEGNNTIQFVGKGQSGQFGQTIDNVQLYGIKQAQVENPNDFIIDTDDILNNPVDPNIHYNQTHNYIKNSDFQIPKLNGTTGIIKSDKNGWIGKNDQVQILKGSNYNPRWKSQVLSLDNGKNLRVRQYFNLKSGPYKLVLNHANTVNGTAETNRFSVYWNGVLIDLYTTSDQKIHTKNIPLRAINGTNQLQLRGQGTADSIGQTIDKLKLFRGYQGKIQGQIDESEPTTPNIFDNSQNLWIDDGQDQQSSESGLDSTNTTDKKNINYNKSKDYINDTSGWVQKQNQSILVNGPDYNPGWKGKVISLDNGKNLRVSQNLTLSPGPYQLIFKHANTINKTFETNRFSVFLNGRRIQLYRTLDYKIHTSVLPLTITKINNVLQFRGEGTQDSFGHTINKIKLYKGNYVDSQISNPNLGTQDIISQSDEQDTIPSNITNTNVTQPTDTNATQPTNTNVTQPTDTNATQPTNTNTTQPTNTNVTQPTNTNLTEPSQINPEQKIDNQLIDFTLNYVTNGDFQDPKISQGVGFKKVPFTDNWKSSQNIFYIVRGDTYNSDWKSDQVGYLHKFGLLQQIQLKKGLYHLEFDHANRQGTPAEDQEFNLYWNKKLIKHIITPDEQIYHASFNLPAIDGKNILQFIPITKQTKLNGHTIDNVKLFSVNSLDTNNPVLKNYTLDIADKDKWSQIIKIDQPIYGNSQFWFNYGKLPDSSDNPSGFQLFLGDQKIKTYNFTDRLKHKVKVYFNNIQTSQPIYFKSLDNVDNKFYINNISLYTTVNPEKTPKLITCNPIYDNTTNYIKDANFELKQYKKKNILHLNQSKNSGWQSNSGILQVGWGSIYNYQWKSRRVATVINNIYQNVNLKEGFYTLKLLSANREWIDPSSNKFGIYWNNQLIKTFARNDTLIHETKLRLKATDGINKLEFRKIGKQDGYGASIDNIGIYKEIECI